MDLPEAHSSPKSRWFWLSIIQDGRKESVFFLPVLFFRVVDPAGIAAGKAAHGGNGLVPEIPEPGFKRNAPDQITPSAENHHGQRKAAYSDQNIFQCFIHGSVTIVPSFMIS
jgi:hypothetical protein